MPLLRFLATRRERRELVERDVSDLLTFLGDGAYPEARHRARDARMRGNRAGDRHWSKVAVGIADRTGYVIGETVVDRYEASRRNTVAESARSRRPL